MSNIEELLHTFESHVMRMVTVSDIPAEDLAHEINIAREAVLHAFRDCHGFERVKFEVLLKLIKKVLAYSRGEGEYDFRGLSEYDCENERFDAWLALETMLDMAVKAARGGVDMSDSITLVEQRAPELQDGIRCEICGIIGARFVFDPFASSDYHKIVGQWLCPACEELCYATQQ